jgi:hypothetical protein
MLNKRKTTLILSLSLLFLIASCVYALEIGYPTMGGQQLGKQSTFPDYVKYIFNFAIAISGVIAFVVLIFNGFKYLTSAGETGAMNDAKNKITGAFIGIIMLLGSYLLLTTINPGLAILSLQPAAHLSGVCLIDTNNQEHCLAQDTDNLGFTPQSVKFLSGPDNLISVYQADETEVPNVGAGQTAGFSGNAISFLWRMPGVYLYPQVGFKGRPMYYSSSQSALGNFDNRANAIKFISPAGTKKCIILFDDFNFRGQAAFTSIDIENLGSGRGAGGRNYTTALGNNVLSSFKIFNCYEQSTSKITFYDSIDCKGNKYDATDPANPNLTQYEFSGVDTKVANNILSIEIEGGNSGVLLCSGINDTGKCQLFYRESSPCISSLGSYLYEFELSALTWVQKAQSYQIVPLSN